MPLLWPRGEQTRPGGQGPPSSPPRNADSFRIADSPRISLLLDDMGNVLREVHVRYVDRVGDERVKRVIHTFPQVSHFRRSSQKEFLKPPLYCRDHPPCRSCG